MKNIQYGTEFLDQLKDRVHDLYDENVKLKEEIERLKEEYIILQNASDEVEEEKEKEIKRLNKRIEDLSIINEEHKILNEMIRKELQQKENIIKEVRKYIKDNFSNEDKSIWHEDMGKILRILDKESK